MSRRTTLLAGGAAVAAALGAAAVAAALAVPAAAGPRPAHAYHDEAYGLAVRVDARTLVGPEPYVRSRDGRPVHDSTASVDVHQTTPLAALGLDPGRTHVGVLSVNAAAGRAEARATDVAIGGRHGLTAKLIDARCTNGRAQARLVDVRLAGRDLTDGLPGVLAPGSDVGVTNLVSITYGERGRNPDGSTVVNALHLRVAPGLTVGLLGSLLDALDAQHLLRPGSGQVPLSRVRGLDAGQQKRLRGVLDDQRHASRSQARGDGGEQNLADVVVASATCDKVRHHSPQPSASTTVIPAPSHSPQPSLLPSHAPVPTPVHTHHPVTG